MALDRRSNEHEVKPYERLIMDGSVVRDVAMPPGESDAIIDAEIEGEPTPPAPEKDWPEGKPRFDPNHKDNAEPEPEIIEFHNVVAFPVPPRHALARSGTPPPTPTSATASWRT